MPRYCVNENAQTKTILGGGGSEHEVHNLTCPRGHLPERRSRIDLGEHSDCHSALEAARELVAGSVDCCCHCCGPCHTG
jgi:hypothetical protein